MDAFDSSDSSAKDDDAPSPKKALPDFTTRKSDDDSAASGDDSAGWEMEEDRVMNSFLAQTEAEEAFNQWTRIYMYNLFNSQKLFTALHIAETLAHDVACTNERGVPPPIIQNLK